MDTAEVTGSQTTHDDISSKQELKRTPLPKAEIFILFLIQFSEPVTATVIYPFINQFVQETGITDGDETRIGYYAGMIESLFFITESLTVFHWGWLSDRVGRRPVLLFGPLALAIAMLGFGQSQTFWPLVFFRSFQGVFNGNIGVARTAMAEFTDATNIADAYAMIPLMWTSGVAVGPVIGGAFARPVDTWPNSFGKLPFLQDRPYFLPCAIAALVAFASSILAFLGLKETLPSAVAKQKLKKQGQQPTTETSDLISDDGAPDYGTRGHTDSRDSESAPLNSVGSAKLKPLPFRALLVPQVLIPISGLMVHSFSSMCLQVLRPLVYSTSTSLGGLGFTPYKIGMILGVYGVVNATMQINFLGRAIRKFGPRTVYMVGMGSICVNLSLYPLLRYTVLRAGRVDASVWTVVIIQLIVNMLTHGAYGAIQIIIVNSAPNPSSLGSTNGLAQAGGCAARSLAPTIASSLFSMSLQSNVAGGNIVYMILIGVTFVGLAYTWIFLPKKLRSLH